MLGRYITVKAFKKGTPEEKLALKEMFIASSVVPLYYKFQRAIQRYR